MNTTRPVRDLATQPTRPADQPCPTSTQQFTNHTTQPTRGYAGQQTATQRDTATDASGGSRHAPGRDPPDDQSCDRLFVLLRTHRSAQCGGYEDEGLATGVPNDFERDLCIVNEVGVTATLGDS